MNQLKDIVAKWRGCSRCPLASKRPKLIGSLLRDSPGTDDPLLLVVGEASSAEDEKQGEVFAGRSGRHFRNEVLAPAGARLVYLTNLCCCRPKNGGPETAEIAVCEQHVAELFATLDPDAVLAVGDVAAGRFETDLLRAAFAGAPTANVRSSKWILQQTGVSRARETETAVSIVARLLVSAGLKPKLDGQKQEHVHRPALAGVWRGKDCDEELWVCLKCAEVVSAPERQRRKAPER